MFLRVRAHTCVYRISRVHASLSIKNMNGMRVKVRKGVIWIYYLEKDVC